MKKGELVQLRKFVRIVGRMANGEKVEKEIERFGTTVNEEGCFGYDLQLLLKELADRVK